MNQEKVQQKVLDLIDGATECARQVFEEGNVGQQLENVVKKTEATIRKHPVKSVAVGLVSGFIIGKILS